MKIVCDYCGKFKPGMVGCEKCNVDICRSCVSEKTISIVQNSLIEIKASAWHCTEVNRKKKKKTSDLVLDFKANGEITGSGLNNDTKENFEILGYYYLTNVAMLCTFKNENDKD
jgi:hypothetical protein